MSKKKDVEASGDDVSITLSKAQFEKLEDIIVRDETVRRALECYKPNAVERRLLSKLDDACHKMAW